MNEWSRWKGKVDTAEGNPGDEGSEKSTTL